LTIAPGSREESFVVGEELATIGDESFLITVSACFGELFFVSGSSE